MKTLCVRFDIDTPTCLREGVPPLLELNERLGFKSSYFLSVGRAISRLGTLRRMAGRKGARTERAAGLSARRKLGTAGYIRLALLNPDIGRGAPEIVQRLSRQAELGLHGGRNHDVWQHHAHQWPRARVESEIDWALEWLAGQEISVAGFCSPGWNEAPGLAAVLRERGFLYRADRYGPGLTDVVEELPGFLNMPTNLVGVPGGVAYLEHKRAQGLSDAAIRTQFRQDLAVAGDHAVMYDHPYYAGMHALDLLEDLVSVAMDAGYTLVTLSDMARAFAARSADGIVP